MSKISEFFSKYLKKIDDSFKKSLKGQENQRNIMLYWGLIAYLVVYFGFNFLIRFFKNDILTLFLSSLVIAYFSWHIFALFKSRPKKPKLTKEQKIELKKKKRKNFGKSFARKMLLQEPITKWNNVHILIVLDLLYILIFLEYII